MPATTSRKLLAIFAALAAALACAGPVYAAPTGSASQDAYGGQGQQVLGTSDEGATPSEAASPAGQVAASTAKATPAVESKGLGSLPFTGFDVLALAGGGIVLVLIGMSVRQLSRRPV